MVNPDIGQKLSRFEIPGRLTFLEGNGELPKIEVTTDWSTAEIYLHGAHVTDFRKRGEPPLLFLSQFSRFTGNQPIRGGVPIIFPWFGAREGEPMHGFARLAEWELHEALPLPEGGMTLRFHLPESAEGAIYAPCTANYVVTVTDVLTLELIITNVAADQNFTFETCLHTYLAVRDIAQVSVRGLNGKAYFDQVDNFSEKTENAEAIRFSAEVDRIFCNAPEPVEVVDPQLRRVIRIEKSGALSTVVWNPWVAKSQRMPDFGNDEYRQMLCVESGNVRRNQVVLSPGKCSITKVVLSSQAL